MNIMLVVGTVIAIYLILWRCKKLIHIKSVCTEEVSAVILSYKITLNDYRDYIIELKFTYNDTEYIVTETMPPDYFIAPIPPVRITKNDIGKCITLLINPNNPKEFIVYSNDPNFFTKQIITLFTVGIILLLLFIL